jgi:hypothetical protein
VHVWLFHSHEKISENPELGGMLAGGYAVAVAYSPL